MSKTNVVVWARVSSREQKEGYSLDAQIRANRQKAERENMKIVKEFSIAESAKRGVDREEFNRMVRWVKQNARKERIGGILAHKLDRICRNMRDAVRMQELEDDTGVRLFFVENEFGPGAAGQLSFNVMAAVSQYYSDNLQSEVLKGMNEKVRSGWLPGWAPYGYRNVKEDKNEPIQLDPEQARAVVRIFELYARGDQTFETLKKRLKEEGFTYKPRNPTFSRTTLSYILNNRFYLGEIKWRGKQYPGKHRPLVSHHLYNRCHELLHGRNRRTGEPNLAYSGGLFTCAYCGHGITGERIRRKLADGTVREHVYYRCANNERGKEHPVVRWKEADLEEAILKDLQTLRMPDEETAAWFREAVIAAMDDKEARERQRKRDIAARIDDMKKKRDRLLEAYLEGCLDDVTYMSRNTELTRLLEEGEKDLKRDASPTAGTKNLALSLVDFAHDAKKIYNGSKIAEKREILDLISLNRTLSDVSLALTKRRPFDYLAERPFLKNGRGDWI